MQSAPFFLKLNNRNPIENSLFNLMQKKIRRTKKPVGHQVKRIINFLFIQKIVFINQIQGIHVFVVKHSYPRTNFLNIGINVFVSGTEHTDSSPPHPERILSFCD